ncbi:hypothetical protein ABFT23_01785 [Nocardioides sp. C4-1]|uniref:hypothetical protein n=1 Tax=Nocardioides sp. C4-1 TaxID=3151851 RepID=UPI0032663EDB
MSPLPDTCPQCGAPLFPVLETPGVASASGTGSTAPVPADPPFRLSCGTCPPPVAPALG